MPYSKVLTIQDISCLGQCSLTVALPILSACGQETVILPSAVLSNHTAPGFSGFTFCDLTEEIPNIHQQWKKENVTFNYIYTGYLGSTKQVGYVLDIFNTMKSPGCITAVDPAMADNGRLYVGFDEDYVQAMRSLCSAADFILPNLTEACFLTGIPYRETYDPEYIRSVLEGLGALGTKSVVLTGIGFEKGKTGVIVWNKDRFTHYEHTRLSCSFHGTGDIYSSAFVGALANGKDADTAARIAADYTVLCIKNTVEDAQTHWYGVKFETALGDLICMLQ